MQANGRGEPLPSATRSRPRLAQVLVVKVSALDYHCDFKALYKRLSVSGPSEYLLQSQIRSDRLTPSHCIFDVLSLAQHCTSHLLSLCELLLCNTF